MRLVSLLFLMAMGAGCSSASSTRSSTTTGEDASPADTPADGSAGDTKGSGDDAAELEAGDAGTSGPGAGSCAACTASDCLSALEACGASQTCLEALQEFNTCYGGEPSAGAMCGTKLASTSSAASTLWSCMGSKCQASCG